MKQSFVNLSILLGVFLAAPAYAGEGKPLPMDADGDGLVSQAEWEEAQRKRVSMFSEIDADGDGYLTREEIRQHFRQKRRDRSRETF
ncbi:MAG: hypothetical protein AAF438_16755 [Pseudomonadota bacterium]